MNKLYCITSHCDNLKKVESLKRTIKQLNDLNRDILLVSHIPLSEDIIESVNYFIYDRSNPILYSGERIMFVWHKININGEIVSLNITLPDYGFTAINQFSRIASFCDNLNYDFYEIINYDIEFTEEILNNTLSKNFLTKVYDPNHGYRWPSLMWFGVTPSTMKLIKDEWTRKDYVRTNLRDAEEYVEKKYTQYGFEKLDMIVYDNCDFTVTDKNSWFNFNTQNDIFKIFSDGQELIFYDLVNQVKFLINDEIYFIENNTRLNIPRKDIKSIGYHDYDDKLVDILYMLDALNENKVENRSINEDIANG